LAKPFQLHIKESIQQLRALQRKHGTLIGKRMQVLIIIKEHEQKGGISKRALSAKTGINHNSILKWRKMYQEQGIDPLLKHNRRGSKPMLLSREQLTKLKAKLEEPQNGMAGYKELRQWVLEELGVDLKYITLYKLCKRLFGTKLKVARKSHIKKSAEAVTSLKKTSVAS